MSVILHHSCWVNIDFFIFNTRRIGLREDNYLARFPKCGKEWSLNLNPSYLQSLFCFHQGKTLGSVFLSRFCFPFLVLCHTVLPPAVVCWYYTLSSRQHNPGKQSVLVGSRSFRSIDSKFVIVFHES